MAGHSFVSKFGHFILNFENSVQRLNHFSRGTPSTRRSHNHSNSFAFENRCLRKIKLPPCSVHARQCNYYYSTVGSHHTHDVPVSAESHADYGSTFQNLLLFRQKQAQCSVLLELVTKDDVPYASALCQNFGKIENIFTYSGESNNVFLLVEFCDASIANSLLSSCQCTNISDTFPISSRLVRFQRIPGCSMPQVHVDIMEDNQSYLFRPKPKNVSELIEDAYLSEKLSELSIRLRFFFCALLKDAVSGLFPRCEVLPFGSSVNGIGRQGCDLDVVMRLYPQQIGLKSDLLFLNKTCVGDANALQRKTIISLADFFRTFLPGISTVHKIIYARVPIMKMNHRILKMDCDVSINNTSAVLMSELVYFCGEVDDRVRPLIYAVKVWAKEANVTYETPGSWITNFGLTLLVLFFLQTRPTPILPPFNDAMQIMGEETTSAFKVLYLKSISELQREATKNTEPLAALLQEFLTFLGTYPFIENHLSLLSGSAFPRNDGSPIWIQYPLEEGANVTKNISPHEFYDLQEKAFACARFFSTNMSNKFNPMRDLSLLLGVPNIKKLELKKGRKLDVGALLVDDSLKHSKKKVLKKRIT